MTREEAIQDFASFLQAELVAIPDEQRHSMLQALREFIFGDCTFTPDDMEVWSAAIERAFPKSL